MAQAGSSTPRTIPLHLPAAIAEPKYSILIPTRNGGRYLPHAIDSVLSQAADNFELVVSDNHSSDETADYLAGLSDPRLVKLKPDRELPMTLHFEYILSHARGLWVTIIGDDDGLMPFFFDYLDAFGLEMVEAPAIVFRRASYFWEGCQELCGDAVVSYQPSLHRRLVKNRGALFRALCLKSDYNQLPQIYTSGLVRSDFVAEVKRKSGGRVFWSTSPDAASAALLALHAPFHLRVEQPIFWCGISPKSTGYSNISSQLKAPSADFDKLNSSHGMEMARSIPAEMRKKLDMQVILYDSLLLCPDVPAFWSSSAMKWFFVAGKVLKGGDERATALKAFGGRSAYLRIAPFLFLLALIKLADQIVLRPIYSRLARWKRRAGLKSNDRAKYPDMRQASEAVMKLYRKRSSS